MSPLKKKYETEPEDPYLPAKPGTEEANPKSGDLSLQVKQDETHKAVTTTVREKPSHIDDLKKAALLGINLDAQPGLREFYELLEEYGIIDKLAEDVSQSQSPENIYKTLDSQEEKTNMAFQMLRRAIPRNFIIDHIDRIYGIKRSREQAASNNQPKAHKNLFHALPDYWLLRILRNGGFLETTEATETTRPNIGTGPFEKHLGINGIFLAYGTPYAHAVLDRSTNDNTGDCLETQNVLVFPYSALQTPRTICLENGAALSKLLPYDWDLPSLGELGISFPEIDPESYPSDPVFDDIFCKRKNNKPPLVLRYLISALFRLYETIITPESVIENSEKNNAVEIVIQPEHIPLPRMIIVNEEPEYFADEITGESSAFDGIPIITFENIDRALAELKGEESLEAFIGKPFFYRKKISLFVQKVDEEKIDLNKWAYKK
jgi:hypothetical protein